MVSEGSFPGPYSQPFKRDYGRLREKITAATCTTLQEQGYVVVDECFGRGWAGALLDEMKWLHAHGHFKPNKTQFALTQQQQQPQQPQRVVQFVKPHIFEVDLHDARLRTKVPELDALFRSTELLEIFSQHIPEYDLQFSTSGRTLKLQRNAGHGGCFPCHYDNPGKPNARKLTCLLYLNDAWVPTDGGEVQLMPFLKAPATVAPHMDRMVIFMSDWMLHRVLPSRAERYCLTIWLDGGAQAVNTPADSQLRLSPSDFADWFAFLERLRKSPVQRLLSRGVYAEEYYESLMQCMQHAGNAGFVEMLQSHETHLAHLERNVPLAGFIERLRHVRETSDETPVVID